MRKKRAALGKKTTAPAKRMLRLATPFERRMLWFSKFHNVPPLGSLEAVHLQRMMQMDVSFQLRMKTIQKRLPHILNARLKNGSGLQMSKLLRNYFLEYFDRYVKHGPDSFPSSFNVVESFLTFSRENLFFDLRQEKEFLLSIGDYFRWYEKAEIPKDTRLLEQVMPAGIIHSYDMISEKDGPRISGSSQQVLAGVSLIRHEHEVSCVLLAGERPASHIRRRGG